VGDFDELLAPLKRCQPEKRVTPCVRRAGKDCTPSVTLGESEE
jgi:hypothetical protein